ncbi:MAG: hypothetical protein KI790_10130 [Cyclobacteriaceae bacterium]|nr:hypothetical protein [Cyclobacteriaceae bacterium HetDA_MAG_MS6]
MDRALVVWLTDSFLLSLGIYLLLGTAFSIYFVFAGANRLDPGVKDAPWHFRLIIWPGSVLLWVTLLTKLLKKK